jgi:predicted kinase
MAAGGRRVVLVSGVPGAGKSTLAGPLAAGLGFALLGKDRIKETLHGALGAPEAGQPYLRDRPWTKWLGGAAMELIWALAADAPDVVLEANFRPHSEYERGRITALTALGGQVVEVYCDCPIGLATARYNGRAATRHPVHVVDTLTEELAAEFDQPIGLGELVRVDTSVPADVARVVDEVLARFERLGAGGTDADLVGLGESSP